MQPIQPDTMHFNLAFKARKRIAGLICVCD
jgi:hypothetical protein